MEIGGNGVHELLNDVLQFGDFIVHVFNSSFEPHLNLVTVLLLLRALDELHLVYVQFLGHFLGLLGNVDQVVAGVSVDLLYVG